MKANIIKLQSHGDERGSLIALEQGVNIPFEIKRVYYIFDTKEGVARGHHAHQNLSQIAVVVRGSCDFVLDNGKERIDIRMDNPLEGLIINSMTWREMSNFSDDCVLMVLASQLYNEDDYIRNYDDFLMLTNPIT